MRVNHVFAGAAVADIEPAREWYERLMGRPPDVIPNTLEASWQLAADGWIYVVQDPERAGSGLLTLLVDDLETVAEDIAERGIEVGSIDITPGVVARAVVKDPDGNTITFGQPLRGEGEPKS